MYFMETNDFEKQDSMKESEAEMSFVLDGQIANEVPKLALSMGESNDAVAIPSGKGSVLVRNGSTAYFERKEMKGVLMIPVTVSTIIHGAETEVLFFVCTK
jgi:hypothetical protein